jgi:hypothetical protein
VKLLARIPANNAVATDCRAIGAAFHSSATAEQRR